MIECVELAGFRCFENLSVRQLSRINLIVGHNNCGKTSLLEAILTLTRAGDPSALSSFMSARDEMIRGATKRRPELDIRRLFFRHSLDRGSTFSISSRHETASRCIRFDVVPVPPPPTESKSSSSQRTSEPSAASDSLVLKISLLKDEKPVSSRSIPISSEGGIDAHLAGLTEAQREKLEPASFVSVEKEAARETAANWSEIALTEDEARVEACLRLIEPSFQRIGFVKDRLSTTGEFRVKLRDFPNPIPIGSTGAGMSRLLALAISLVRCKGGILLVDELDTGLHHSILTDVWRFVIDVAHQLDVQVFATTHSLDCVRGLAQICGLSPASQDRISMHRIERGKPEAIHYSERQIVIAAERGIETR